MYSAEDFTLDECKGLKPIPRSYTKTVEYDNFLPDKFKDWCKEKYDVPNCWGGSGHYGREKNLLISHKKPCGFIDKIILDEHWQDCIDDFQVFTTFHDDLRIVTQKGEFAETLANLLTNNRGHYAVGLILGYDPIDVARYKKHVETGNFAPFEEFNFCGI